MAKKKEEACCELCEECCGCHEEPIKKKSEEKIKNKQPKEEKIKIRFCPKCGNTEVKYVFKLRNVFGIVPRIECPKCGYHNMIFPLIEVEKGKIKDVEKLIFKEPKKGNKK